jgi:hypothetical protein
MHNHHKTLFTYSRHLTLVSTYACVLILAYQHFVGRNTRAERFLQVTSSGRPITTRRPLLGGSSSCYNRWLVYFSTLNHACTCAFLNPYQNHACTCFLWIHTIIFKMIYGLTWKLRWLCRFQKMNNQSLMLRVVAKVLAKDRPSNTLLKNIGL